MAPLDWFVVIVLGLSMVVGLWRGLLFEVISLAGWVAAFLCAQWFAQDLADWLPFGASDAIWRYAVGFVLIFIVVAFGIGLVASLVRKLITVVGLRPVDRVLGAVFGLTRGAVVVLTVAVVIHLFSLNGRIWWREAYSATVADTALKSLKPVLPEKLASFLP